MSEDLRKDCDLCDTESWCDNCNEEESWYCDNDKKDDCCCDIKSLRKILELFERQNVQVRIVTRNENFTGYVFEITKDLVYLSNTFAPNPTPTIFIPLCNIVRFSTINPITNTTVLGNLSAKIQYFIRSTCNLNPCCCTDGIAEVVNGFRRSLNNTSLLCFNLDTDVDLVNPNLDCFSQGQIIKANSDVVFAIKDNRIFIYPTCGIDSLEVARP